MDNPSKSVAIVMGASLAGLWTARTLAPHFGQVIVVEKDDLTSESKARPGTPQARQYHILLLRGLQVLQSLFPGLDDELRNAGATSLDLTQDILIRFRGEWLSQFPSGQTLLSCNRILLESYIRHRVAKIPNVMIRRGVEITGLETDDERTTVIGIKVHERKTGEGAVAESSTIHGDLIVDATGRRSRTREWFTQIGFEVPDESVVDSFLGYVTRRYRSKPGAPAGLRPLLVSGKPPDEPVSGLIFPEENGNWVVMIAGVNKNYPPVQEDEFNEFTKRLGPEFHDAVSNAEPISKAYGYRGTQSLWRHYEKLRRWPERYVVLGDAFCAFNPIYGQGMTVSAICALELAKEVEKRRDLTGLANKMRRKFAKISNGPWLLATGADLEWPLTEGKRRTGLADRIAGWYLNQVLIALPHDEKIRLMFNKVNQMVEPIEALFSPAMIFRVLRNQRLGKMVEAAGIEPASESGSQKTSTRLAI